MASSQERDAAIDGLRRRVATDESSRATGLAEARGSQPAGTSAPWLPARKVTVDDRRFSGGENAIYAPDNKTVFVAYKRFLAHPYDSKDTYVPARLHVARSRDGGRTWKIDMIDPDAIEAADLVDQTVAIGGDGHGTIYVAYIVQSTGQVSDNFLRLARSTDNGKTWATATVLDEGAGGYVDIKVEDEQTLLIALKRAGGNEPLWLYGTSNAGLDWESSEVEAYGWWSSVDTGPAGKIWLSYYNPGLGSLETAYSSSASGPWTPLATAGQGDDNNFTGLGSSLDVPRNGHVYTAYENFRQARGISVVRVAKSPDGGDSWTDVRVDSAIFLGWNTSIDVVAKPEPALDHAFVTYWFGRPNTSPPKGRLRFAYSRDDGATWTPRTISEKRHVEPFIDLVAPSENVQYISYQSRHPENEMILRVAKVKDL